MRLLAGRMLGETPVISEAQSTTPGPQAPAASSNQQEPIVTATPLPSISRETNQKIEAINRQVQSLNNSVESLSKCVAGINDKLTALVEADKILDTGLKTTNLNLQTANQRILEQGQKTTSTKAIANDVEHKVKTMQEQLRKLEEKQVAPILEKLTALEERRLKASDARMDKLESLIHMVDGHAVEAGQRVLAIETRFEEVAELIREELAPEAAPPAAAPAPAQSDDEVIMVGRATSVAARIEAAGPASSGTKSSNTAPVRASRSATARDTEEEVDPANFVLPQRTNNKKRKQPAANHTG